MKQVARLLKWCVVITMFISGVPRLSHAVEMLPQGDFEAGVSDWIMWHCKGAGAVGAVSGGLIPDLRHTDQWRRDNFQQIVRDGILRPLGMPSFKNSLSAAEVEQIKAYVMRREYDDYLKAQQAAKP